MMYYETVFGFGYTNISGQFAEFPPFQSTAFYLSSFSCSV